MTERMLLPWFESVCCEARVYEVRKDGKVVANRCAECKEECKVFQADRPSVVIPDNFKAAR